MSGTLAALGIASLAEVLGLIDESGARKKDRRVTERGQDIQKEIALEQLGFKREEMELLENQRRFNRLKDLISTGSGLRDKTMGLQRLKRLRASR